MQNVLEIVELLEDKFRLLVEKQDLLEKENEALSDNLTLLKQELTEKERLLEESVSELHSLRVAKTIQGSNDSTKETTHKINTLIKEIDACIVQLSD